MKNLTSDIKLSTFDLDAITNLLLSKEGNPAFNKLAEEMVPDESRRKVLLLRMAIVVNSPKVDPTSIEPRYVVDRWEYRNRHTYTEWVPSHVDRIHNIISAKGIVLNDKGEQVDTINNRAFDFSVWDGMQLLNDAQKALMDCRQRLAEEKKDK